MKATVKIYEDGNLLLTKVLEEGVYRAGRSDFSDLLLPHESVSRTHFELRVTEAAVYVTNMSGTGKVKVNGRPAETAELNDGDEVTIGPYQVFVFHGEEALAPNDANPPADENIPPSEGSSEPVMEQEPDLNAGGDGVPSGGVPIFDLNGNREGGGAENPEPVFGQPDAFAPQASLESSQQSEGTSALSRGETQVELKPVIAKLIFTEGPRSGEEIFLETFEVTLGRSKKADIYLDDEKLSRIHAKITRVGMGYRLIDLNSRNGTYVNGMRVLEHPLTSFDQIEIGHSKIKFLIHDIVSSDLQRQAAGTLVPVAAPLENTKSIQLDSAGMGNLIELQRPGGMATPGTPSFGGGMGVGSGPQEAMGEPMPQASEGAKRHRLRIVAAIAALLLITYFVIPTKKESSNEVPAAGLKTRETLGDVKAPPAMPKEYLELTPESQRAVEGYYNTAQQFAAKEQYEEAVAYLKRIHEAIDYYKNSRELLEQYSKKVKEKQIAEAQERAKKDEKQDLALYLEDGLDYLRRGEFDKAAEAFNSAIVIDPNNTTATQGLKAAEYKVTRIEDIPPERDPEQEKRKLVAELFQKAVTAFTNKGYQEAIDTAEKIRQIELKGDTQYLNEAKQIIDRARMLQKEEFEPFLIQAKEKFAEGDYNASRDLCEEMLKRDGAYEEAKECALKAKKQLNRLAKEAYTHGYILESMNRIDEAKQYWNRAKNYVRSGDDYFDKVTKKLEYYQ